MCESVSVYAKWGQREGRYVCMYQSMDVCMEIISIVVVREGSEWISMKQKISTSKKKSIGGMRLRVKRRKKRLKICLFVFYKMYK